MKRSIAQNDQPLIPANVSLPEITLKSVITAIALAMILGASNAYLALKVGTTVAASIPAAVISMGVFRFFKKSNVLENNIVQTAASAGEGLACVAAFILPALVILGYWHGFRFWDTTLVILLGGLLGVLFSVPLRRALLDLPSLRFPEGTATGNVLKASARGGAQLKNLVRGGLAGAAIVFSQTGLEFISSYLPLWFRSGQTLFGISLGFDPVLLGAGYIIGINAGLAMFVGTFFGWIIGVPILSWVYGVPAGANGEAMVMTLWGHYIRYIGVGTMMVAGIWTLLTLFKPIMASFSVSLRSIKAMHLDDEVGFPRTEKDIPLIYVLGGILALLFLMSLFAWHAIVATGLLLSGPTIFGISAFSILFILVFGFFSAMVCGYLVGLIGSTNTPMSGILIINILVLSLILFPMIGSHVDLGVHLNQQAAIAIVILIVTMVGSAAVITNENIQDLKAGRMVGATPWKQQVMMMIGITVSSVVMAPVLELLLQAYGMGGVFPHPGMNPAQMLPAPQAGLMAALAQGVIGHDLPMNMMVVGGIIAVVCILIDEFGKRRDFALPVLAVGLGIYLPPEIIMPTLMGGAIHFLVSRQLKKRVKKEAAEEQQALITRAEEGSVLLACGIVAGSSLMGVVLAIPFVLKGSSDALKIVSTHFLPIANVLGLIVTVAVLGWMYRTGSKPQTTK